MALNLEKLNEFHRFASLLQMPTSERLGILNVSEELYTGLRIGHPGSVNRAEPELERRLSYALPLMRRLVSNSPVVGIPTAGRCAA